ncbi:MAG: hypothetical protein WCI60_02725 [bacterium]
MEDKQQKTKIRIRIGVALIFLWWIPFWLVTGLIISTDDIQKAAHQRNVLIATIVIQSILGIIGAFLVGKTMVSHMKHQKFRKFPKIAWQLFKSGNIED